MAKYGYEFCEEITDADAVCVFRKLEEILP